MESPRTVTSWLCRDGADRQRVLDMERRIRRARMVAFLILGAALLATGPSIGFWTLLPLVVSAAGFALMDRGLEDAPRPEYRLAGAWVISELAIAASIALSGGPRSPAVAWLAIPVVTLGARFSHRGVLGGLGVAACLILAVTFGIHPGYAAHHISAVIFPLALLGSIAVLSIPLMTSDLHFRGAAVIDPLTGMLNRNALTARVGELSQQALIARRPVGMVLGDLDLFKSINDAHGHAAGDAVLRDVADRLRQTLHAFDHAYRVGGEEFLILLPGASAEESRRVAEELRAAVTAQPVAGLFVSMSFGATASAPGAFDFETAFAAADLALYEAKRAGRDQVRLGAVEEDGAAAGRADHPAVQLSRLVGARAQELAGRAPR